MKKIYSIFILLLIVSCGGDNQRNKEEIPVDFDVNLQLSSIYNLEIIPLIEKSKSNSKLLEESLIKFIDNSTPQNFIETQEVYKLLVSSWEELELYNFGTSQITSATRKISQAPTSNRIESIIDTDEVIDTKYVKNQGNNVKGINAVEYLLFNPKIANEDIIASLSNNSKRVQYLQAITKNISLDVNEFETQWKFYKNEFETNIENTTLGSQNKLVNAIISKLQEITNVQLGEPLGIRNKGIIAQENLLGYRSTNSLAILKSNFAAIKRVVKGDFIDKTSSNLGVINQLNELEIHKLSDTITSLINNIEKTLATFSTSLEETLVLETEKVQLLRSQFNRLFITFNIDVSSQLNIITTKNDNDGD